MNHVRFGSKADICSAKRHVRFTPKSGQVRCNTPCLLSANSGHDLVHSMTSSTRTSMFGGIGIPSDSEVRLHFSFA